MRLIVSAAMTHCASAACARPAKVTSEDRRGYVKRPVDPVDRVAQVASSLGSEARRPAGATDARPEHVSPVHYRSTDQEVAGSNPAGRATYGAVFPGLITRSAGRVELIFCG
jgi:hypothetical protein